MSEVSARAAIGVDVGSATVKVVAMVEGRVVWTAVEPTEPRMDLQADRLVARVRNETGLDGSFPVVATGYGRHRVAGANRRLTEITAHARGVAVEAGGSGTVVDIGGQDTKVVLFGAGGKVRRFVMNDKCAAGSGRFLEVVAARLQLPLHELGRLALGAAKEVPISSTCTVFAESEIVSGLAQGLDLAGISLGLHRALVRRVTALVRSIGSEDGEVWLTGGVALNPAIPPLLGRELGLPVRVPESPQLTGAIGAALLALDARDR